MPGTRLEIAELFVEHQVHAVIELDQITIGIVVVDRDVVTGSVPYRSPEDLEFVASEQVAGLMHMRGVAQFERQMVDARLSAACKIHRVMLGAATQEDEILLDPVGDTETENSFEEFRGPFRVGRIERDVTELGDGQTADGFDRPAEVPPGEQLDLNPVRIVEDQRFRYSGRRVAPDFRRDMEGRQRLLQLGEIEVGRNLVGNGGQTRGRAAFENEREFKRKVRTLAGNYQLYARMPELLVPPTNPLWFETISHKILRLVAPWLLVTLALMSVAGAAAGDGRMTALLVAQAAFYAAAVVGRRGGKVASLARTFVVLNWAAIVGLYRHLTGRQRVTW